jgi:hypothetical protein
MGEDEGIADEDGDSAFADGEQPGDAEGTRLHRGDETGAWEYPEVVEDEDEAGQPLADLDSEEVRPTPLTEEETEQDLQEMREPPELPDALFEEDHEGSIIVHWHVDTDLGVVVMSNRVLVGDAFTHVEATTCTDADGNRQWEIPRELMASDDAVIDIPDAALFTAGEPIHFRASEAMFSGETRTCYALTPDALARLELD